MTQLLQRGPLRLFEARQVGVDLATGHGSILGPPSRTVKSYRSTPRSDLPAALGRYRAHQHQVAAMAVARSDLSPDKGHCQLQTRDVRTATPSPERSGSPALRPVRTMM